MCFVSVLSLLCAAAAATAAAVVASKLAAAAAAGIDNFLKREKLHVDTSPQEVVLSTTEWTQAQTEHARRSRAGQAPPWKQMANGLSHAHFVYR